MRLFDRQVRVAIGESGGTGFEIGAPAANGIPLHVKFSFEKADVESPNTGKVTVWNLNKEHLAELEKQDCKVIVRAGYADNIMQAAWEDCHEERIFWRRILWSPQRRQGGRADRLLHPGALLPYQQQSNAVADG